MSTEGLRVSPFRIRNTFSLLYSLQMVLSSIGGTGSSLLHEVNIPSVQQMNHKNRKENLFFIIVNFKELICKDNKCFKRNNFRGGRGDKGYKKREIEHFES
jgi:hypothetical protein